MREVHRDDRREVLPIATRGDHLAHLVRYWRSRLEPERASALGGQARRTKLVSQEHLARIIGFSSHWYARLERGDTGIYSAEFLDRTAAALQLSAAERCLLFLYALGHEPVHLDSPAPIRLAPQLRQLVTDQSHPAFICDESWFIAAHNARMAEWFPSIIAADEPNLIRWAFTAVEARHQLHNWDTEWAPFLLAQLMADMARYPNSARLNHLTREVLAASKFASAIWSYGPRSVQQFTDGARFLRVHAGGVLRAVNIITLVSAQTAQVKVRLIVPLVAEPNPNHDKEDPA